MPVELVASKSELTKDKAQEIVYRVRLLPKRKKIEFIEHQRNNRL